MLRVTIKGKEGQKTIEAKPFKSLDCSKEKNYYWYEYRLTSEGAILGKVIHSEAEGDDNLVIKILMDMANKGE